MGRKLIDLTGQRFGRLEVVRYLGRRHHSSVWECRCDCGAVIEAQSAHLNTGHSRSCGCYRSDRMGGLQLKHGERGGASRSFQSYDYRTWVRMVERCCNPKASHYDRYGGRGITVCERWRENFSAFISDMGRKPSKRHSIDRIDVNGHYEPSNCRWADPLEQARNRSNNRLVQWAGRMMPLSAAAEMAGIRYATVKGRLQKGWTVDDALSRPVDAGKRAAQRHRQLVGVAGEAQRD